VVADDGSLWVGGLFTRTGTTPSVNLVHVSAAEVPSALVGTHPVLGVGGFVDGLAVDRDGNVVAGGSFTFAGTTPTEALASFDGAAWTDLGGDLGGIVRDVIVRQDGSIAVAGELVYGDELVAFAQSTATGWSLPGGAIHGVGYALLEDADGVLWLGGNLSDAGGNLARLDGTTWTADGTFDDRVSALAIYEGNLVAAGSFTGRISIRTGTTWAVPGGGLDGDFSYATALAVSPSLGLVVGGELDGAGGNETPDLARWDGTAWHDVGGGVSGFGGYGFVSALLAYGDGLFVSGGIDTAGTVTVSNLAWFDGTAWHDLGGGLADLAEAMIVADDVLYVGGPFTVAGGRPASGLAAWDFGG
jgi:hypothetical protein